MAVVTLAGSAAAAAPRQFRAVTHGTIDGHSLIHGARRRHAFRLRRRHLRRYVDMT